MRIRIVNEKSIYVRVAKYRGLGYEQRLPEAQIASARVRAASRSEPQHACVIFSARYTYLGMLHRHLNHEELSLAAIDDLIARGKRADWEELREAVLGDSSLLASVREICLHHVQDPYAQRYHFWLRYVQERMEPNAEQSRA